MVIYKESMETSLPKLPIVVNLSVFSPLVVLFCFINLSNKLTTAVCSWLVATHSGQHLCVVLSIVGGVKFSSYQMISIGLQQLSLDEIRIYGQIYIKSGLDLHVCYSPS